ncbi:N-acetylglucosamine kinase [Streptomyces sp. NBC_00887]|uniref:N-acetylglucosamine kinase n=1 Tax=Streptomyces sp. NBC_00887 TaxID=2975859 RepID=UPI003868278A|nr:hypothetical protein OG844_00755 [Streptomyces sp. NBC_00887]WSY36284.1 hypothetical protein OG844_44840 [Streptomyces sp. NBC_00887]
MELTLGVDAGGTASRAVVATPAGRVLGSGRAGGGNPVSRGPAKAASAIAEAVRQALGDLDASRLTAVCVGIAGVGALQQRHVAAEFAAMWSDLGVVCPVRYLDDPLLGFVAGAAETSGHVLLAGTGAVALRIENLQVTACADGLGGVLGDEGSGYWLGREITRAAVRQLAEGRPGLLAQLVVDALLGPGGDRSPRVAHAIAELVQSDPVGTLPPLSPLITAAARAGDPVAAEIADSAAQRLVASLASVREAASEEPIILAGGVLTSAGPVRSRVVALCSRRWPHALIASAGDTALAAAWLAWDPRPDWHSWFARYAPES